MRGSVSLVAALLAAAASREAAPPPLPQLPVKVASASAPPKRVLRRPRALQTITVTDENFRSIPDVFVAADQPTVLLFSVPLAKTDKAVLLSSASETPFEPAEFSDTYVRLLPHGDLPPGGWASLTVALADGNVLTFRLVTDPKEVDVRLDVDVQLKKRAAPESLVALKTMNDQLRKEIDECRSTAGAAGIGKIAALVLAAEEPESVEARAIRGHADKQNRMLLRARHVYRLFGYTYLVLELQNRDDSKVWELERAEMKLQGAGQAVDLEVVSGVMEPTAIEPSATLTGRVVVAFKTPGQQQATQRFSVLLREKNGSRHVQLDSLEL